MKEETYRVMDTKGNTLNFVGVADNERDGDALDVRITKRKADAVKKCQRWQTTHFITDNLIVVPCDIQGKPLVTPRRRI